MSAAMLTLSADEHPQRYNGIVDLAPQAGEKLTDTTMRELIRDLGLTKTAYTCPHGRPTHIEISLYELEKAFGRTGNFSQD